MSRRFVSLLVAVWFGVSASVAAAKEVAGASPKNSAIEFKLGSFRPEASDQVYQRPTGLPDGSTESFNPYQSTFGDESMLLFQLEIDRQLFQSFGSFGVGFSVGYAELYGNATVAATGAESEEKTALKVLPLRALGVYRFDWAALNIGIPFVPYAKAGLAYTPWWITKGSSVEYANGNRGAGGKWGYTGILGLSLLLDVLDPRLARDFDTSMGVNHSYFFVEYVYENVNNFGGDGLDLSSRHFMFGLALEY